MQFTDSDDFSISIKEADLISYEIEDAVKMEYWAEEFGLNEQQKTVWLEERKVPPQYVVDFEDAYLKGADFISTNYTSFVVTFDICTGKDYCASLEEINEYFATRVINVAFLQGASYIEFEDIENPL